MVPEGWKVVTLGEVIHESAFGPRFSAELYSDNGNVGTIRTTDLDNEGNINYKTIPYANLPASFEAHYLKNTDLLITRSGSCGIPCLFERQDKPIIAGAFLIRFILKDNVHPKYIHSLLKSEHLQRDIHNLSSGGVQKNLSGTNLKKLKFILPPLLEQKKVAQILSTWDMAIATTEQLLVNSQQQKKALMQQLLNGHTRLLGFSDRWMGGVLGDIATIDSGFAFKSNTFINTDNGIPVIRMNNLKNGRLDISDSVKISPEITKGLEKFSLLENDFLFGMSGSLNNYAWVTAKDVPCYLNQRVGRITAKNNHDQTFLTYLYLSDKVQKSILDKAEGAAQLNISINELRETPINYPAPKEQKKIAEILLSADNYITKLQQKLHHLKQEKKALMQQLLTGKRRVKMEVA